jgi:8-oxo-dGTP pyrophosphatase MutT (NUDIX family)
VHPLDVLYLEHDGKVLLVNEEGEGPMTNNDIGFSANTMFRFPTLNEVDKMDIDWEEKSHFIVEYQQIKVKITKGYPKISWPKHWIWKDSVFLPTNIHVVVKEAIYRSLHRLVSKLIVHNDGAEVLLAKINRGHFKGFWSLPGGYMDHDEHPEEGCLRETFEELGLQLPTTDGLEIITQKVFNEEGVSFVSFTYFCNWNGSIRDLNPLVEEIAEVRWFNIDEALNHVVSHFDREALNSFLQTK